MEEAKNLLVKIVQEHPMKSYLLLLPLLLAGCSANYPITSDLTLVVSSQPTGIYRDGTTAALTGHDARANSAVIIYRLKGEPEIEIPNQTAVHLVVTEQLADGLKEQGVVFASASPVRIRLDIKELLVTVTRPQLLYRATAKSHLSLTIKNKGMSLTRTYNREANRESVTKPPVKDLEAMVNDQLSNIIEQILQDEEIRTTINT
jgi:uncharacterized lipoprotein